MPTGERLQKIKIMFGFALNQALEDVINWIPVIKDLCTETWLSFDVTCYGSFPHCSLFPVCLFLCSLSLYRWRDCLVWGHYRWQDKVD